MNIQEMVSQALSDNLETLGAETITINGAAVQAVLDEAEQERNLHGGSRVERTLRAMFPTSDSITIRAGKKVQARGQDWKIQSFQKGQATTTLRLIEPNRPADL